MIRMQLVMTLLVRDEEDILDEYLRYHFELGVDFVIATDNLSVDGTVDILRDHESNGVLRVIDEPQDTYDQRRWVTRMARLAHTDHGADWVINSDADEFWWPHVGDLKSTFEAIADDVGIVRVDRHDFVPVAPDGRPFHQRMTWRKARSLDAAGRPLPPKVAHRGRRRVVIGQGNHRVRRTLMKPLQGEVPLEILHYPLRTYEQFENKIVKGGRAYARNKRLPKKFGAGWRQLYDLYEQGGLKEHWNDNELSATEIERAVAAGDLIPDDRLARHLASEHR